jgi:hypothetical protein
MPIESPYADIGDLNVDWPITLVDDARDGAEHIRGLKTVFKSLEASGGSSQLGFIQASGIARTIQAKLRETIDALDYTGVEEFDSLAACVAATSSDSTDGLQDAVDNAAGKPVRLGAGKFYRLGSGGLNIPAGGGLVCDGRATLYCPAAAFTNTSNRTYGTTSTAIRAAGTLIAPWTQLDGITLKGIDVVFEVADTGRYLAGFSFRNVKNIHIEDCSVTGLSMGRGFQFDTVNNVTMSRPRMFDCTTDINTYGFTPTLEFIETDQDRINSTGSADINIDNPVCDGLTYGATAIAAYGYQSDALHFCFGGNHITVTNPNVRFVSEGIDSQAENLTVTGGVFADCYDWALKYIHGAKNSSVVGTRVVRPGRAGIVISSSDANGDVKDLSFSDITIEEVDPDGLFSDTAAIRFLDNGTYDVLRCECLDIKVIGPTTNMDYVVHAQIGSECVVQASSPEGFGVAFSSIASAASFTLLTPATADIRNDANGTTPYQVLRNFGITASGDQMSRSMIFGTGGATGQQAFREFIRTSGDWSAAGARSAGLIWELTQANVVTQVLDLNTARGLFTTGLYSSHPTSGIGYSTGAGGAVTQLTNRTTGVQVDTASGAITLISAAGSATEASFTVTNSAVAATDTVVVSVKSGTNVYLAWVTAVAAGSFRITFKTTGGTAVDSPVINFAVIKAVAA